MLSNFVGLPGFHGETVKGQPGEKGDRGEAGMPLPASKGVKGDQGPVGPRGLDADQKCKLNFHSLTL